MPPLHAYALIGNCETAALVSPQASIDWLCWPNFDSPSCFDAAAGGAGFWRIAPQAGDARLTRQYRGPTPILETTIETATGKARIIDFMPTKIRDSHIVRRVEGLEGEIALSSEFRLRFCSGTSQPSLRRHGDNSLHFIAGPDRAVLRTKLVHDAHGDIFNGEIFLGRFTLVAGEALDFSLTYTPSYADSPRLLDATTVLEQTERTWRAWSGRALYEGAYKDQVMRALISLRASIFQPSGAIVAAVGPESGAENPRVCRLDGAERSMRALLQAGYDMEAKAWRNFLLRAVAGDAAQLQSNYATSGAVAAPTPASLAVYAEIFLGFCEARKGGLNIDPEDWQNECALLRRIEAMADSEASKDPYSLMLMHAAFSHAITTRQNFGLEGSGDHWQALCGKFSGTTEPLGDAADPHVQFGTRSEMPEQAKRLLAAIETSAMHDGLVCTGAIAPLAENFAAVEVLVQAQRHDEAHRLFARLCSFGNELGLLPAHYNVADKKSGGIFPDTAAHVGLINAAFALEHPT
jgi:GH15 family glucan-1,4-alpha-glucosidase